MATNNHKISLIAVLLCVIISCLVINIIFSFNYLDLIYLIFMTCCLIRFIYIKKYQ